MKVGGLGARRAESLKQCWIFGNGRGRSTGLARQVRFDRSTVTSLALMLSHGPENLTRARFALPDRSRGVRPV